MVYLLSLKKLLSGGDFLDKFYVEKTTLKDLVVTLLFQFLSFIIVFIYLTSFTFRNPGVIESINALKLPALFIMSLILFPYVVVSIVLSIFNLFDLFKQDKERKRANGDI